MRLEGYRRLKIFGWRIGPGIYISRWNPWEIPHVDLWSYKLAFIYRWNGLSYKMQVQWPWKITCLQPKLKQRRYE